MPVSDRAGTYVTQEGGFSAFIPRDLPPEPPILMDSDLVNLLAEASAGVGGLKEGTRSVPHPELFVLMFVRKEALLSSRIEGTESTMDDLLEFEAGDMSRHSAREVFRNVDAIVFGIERMKEKPLGLGLLKEIHAVLLEDTGVDGNPGEYRTNQVVVGGRFHPPPPCEILRPLENLETFIIDRESFSPLLQCGIAHAQFETIHPFSDGNGRLGRLLITLLLCNRGMLDMPLLYLSHFFKENQQEYYDRLMAIRGDGDWEGWLKFFLKGVSEVSSSAIGMARSINDLKVALDSRLRQESGFTARDTLGLDFLFENPVVKVQELADGLKCSYPTARKLLEKLARMRIVHESTGKNYGRRYAFDPYIGLFR
jgi:Fic family protein